MSELVHNFEHAGLTVKIMHDECGYDLNPRDNYEPFGTMVSWGIDGYSIGGKDDEDLGREHDFEIECEHCEGTGQDPMCPEPPTTGLFQRSCECQPCEGAGMRRVGVIEYFKQEYDAAIIIPLRFADYGSGGTRLYEVDDEDDTNVVIFLTRYEFDREYSQEWLAQQGCTTDEECEAFIKKQLMAHVEEYDNWAQGNVFGFDIAGPEEDDDEITDLESVDGITPEALTESSCWGFIGDYDDENIIEAAKEAAESIREQIDKELAERKFWTEREVVTI